MNSRERFLTVMHGQLPDDVPACPNVSNMIPARLTGKPFRDIYVHQDPPFWKDYTDAAVSDGFIFSTGDQTPRDTRLENIFALVETACTYGKCYRLGENHERIASWN